MSVLRDENIRPAYSENDDSAITILLDHIARRDRRIRFLENTESLFLQQILEKDKILQDLSTRLSNEHSHFMQQLTDQASHVELLNQAITEKEHQSLSFNQLLAERDEQISKITSSTSWRLTKPMRLVGDLLRQMRRWVIFSLRSVLFAPKLFDSEWYLVQNPDVAKNGMDSYRHYILFGKTEGRKSAPEVPVSHNNKSSIYHMLRIAPQVFSRKKGIWQTCVAGFRIYRHEGIVGIKKRIKQNRTDFQEKSGNVDCSLRTSDAGERLNSHVSLPANFNPTTYLELNPDVRIADIDPVNHYLQHGYLEGRQYAYPKIVCLRPYAQPTKQKTILVICHEASRSGAPIVGLNLIQQLSDTHDVIALLLGEGPLLDEFINASTVGAYLCADLRFYASEAAAMAVVAELCRQFKLDAAIVNSVECHSIVQSLHRQNISTISLLHEFAAYTRPLYAFPRALFWSVSAVFSTSVTRDDVLRRLELRDATNLIILPQGKSRYNSPCINTSLIKDMPLLTFPRATEAVYILGVGTVQYRKGVDLYVECARKMKASDKYTPYHFYWVGGGYQPDSDMNYSVYIADQVQRAGLSNHFTFLGESDQLESIYSKTDLFLLTSRLDPLPNVAIDAAVRGLPILCFAETTGIADFLVNIKLSEYLVADYLDTSSMADKAIAIVQSPDLWKNISDTLRSQAEKTFSMSTYVTRLRSMLDNVIDLRRQEEDDDIADIRMSGALRTDFCIHPSHAELTENVDGEENITRIYVRSWATGLYRRKPFPGFHPGMYAHMNRISERDPFAHYLRAGCPAGPWKWQVITPRDPVAKKVALSCVRVALHIHCYYVELIDQILQRLTLNTVRPDLFITTNSEASLLQVKEKIRNYSGRIMRLEIVPNRGRNIGPLLTMMDSDILSDYDIVGHLHTKKSVSVSDAAVGSNWYVFLLENLLGGENGRMLDRIITAMIESPVLEMIYPDDPYVFGDESNRAILERIAARVGWPTPPQYHGFPVGCMFWARPKALRPLFSLNMGLEDWPPEPLPYDGTILHALERAFGLGTCGHPDTFAVTNVPGVTR